ncbi:MAG: methionine synthase [Deltaproteobacteria bacterium]|nr:methionine synthase [Deltaproteobacteria bacterium]
MPEGFYFIATGVGSLPHQDPRDACEVVLSYMPEAPHWPQLPQLDPQEGMINQFLDGIPGLVEEEGKVFLRSPFEPLEEWDEFFSCYEEGDLDYFAIKPERAQGLYRFLELVKGCDAPFVKGQVTGPVTLGLSLKDEQGRLSLFDEGLRDMIVKVVSMKARWQERVFKEVLPKAKSIIFFDEPTLSAYGSPYMNLYKEMVVDTLREAIRGLQGYKGVHICGNTDWPMIMEVGLDIIDFDAYNHLSSFILYAEEVKAFFERGGAVGWGIIPTEAEALKRAVTEELFKRLEEGIVCLKERGIDEDMLYRGSLITPSCGTGLLNRTEAQKVYEGTRQISALFRERITR